MSIQVVKTSLTPLVQWVIGILANNVVGVNANTVNFSRMPKNPRFAGDRDIVLRVGRIRPIPGLYEAGWEVTPGVVRAFILQLRTRQSLDVSDRNDNWLMGQPTIDFPMVFGQDYFETLVLQVMQDTTLARPVDGDGNLLTIEPMRLVDGAEFADEMAQIPPPDDTWGESKLVFSVSYMAMTGSL